jgi:urease accessory protein
MAMVRGNLVSALAAAVLAASAGAAEAHTGIGAAGGLAAGFVHPLLGLDHLLAMLAVGLLAAQTGGRALWLVPVAFLVMMGAGGAIALDGWPLPFVETAIALSVVALAGAVALGASASAVAAAVIAGGFALFHGHAHGAEMPLDASGLEYAAGFLAASATLIGAGLAFGRLTQPLTGGYATRAAAGLVALAGVMILAGVA